jgi:protein arginine N-methyltransferase 1
MTSYTDYSVDSYGAMIRDQARTAPFVEALRRAVQPGSVVLDIGTGTGIFAFLACQFGAARVYAIEPDSAIEVGKICAKDIPGSERITWIQGLSTEIDLPERADVVIGDLHGVLPFFKGNVESLADARIRHLKPGGRMIPSRDVLYAVPAHAPEEYKHVQTPWRQNPYGLDVSAAAPYVFNQWWRARSEPAQPDDLLSSPQRWGVVGYSSGVTEGLDTPMDWEIERAGTLHGLYLWFDGDLGDGLGYSNAPNLPEMAYGRAFFPFEQPTEVSPGDRLNVQLTLRQVKGENVFRWKSHITSPVGVLRCRFDQSTFKATLINQDTLRKASADYMPTLNPDGRVAKAVLEAMDGGQTVQQIADQLAVDYPGKFESASIAFDLVCRLSKVYT